MSGYIIGFAVLLALSALFSAAESAYTGANRLRLESAAEDGKRSAATAVKLLDRYDATIAAILLGNSCLLYTSSSVRQLPGPARKKLRRPA